MDTQQSEYFPDSFARVSVKGLYLKDGKILLCKDETAVPYGKPAVWEMPGGGWDFGETFHDTLRREVGEEMGLELARISERPIEVWPVRRERSRRVPGWYYVLILLFRIDFKNLDFSPTTECSEIGFFTWDEFLQLENVHSQTQPLRTIFTKEDFENYPKK